MNKNITNIESFLISKMSAKNTQAFVLRENKMDFECINKKSLVFENQILFDGKYIFSKDCFFELGDPISEKRLFKFDNHNLFDQTYCLLFNLNVWPKMALAIYRTKEIHYWGLNFYQKFDINLPGDLSSLAPWEWTSDLLISYSVQHQILDSWDGREEVRFTFIMNNVSYKYIGQFDLGLLQNWKID